MELSEQEVIRRNSLKQIEELGINPFPAEEFKVNSHAADILKHYTEEEKDKFTEVSLAGRLMMKRVMGKASFAELQDSSGRIQMYVSRDEICPEEDKTLYNTLFKKLLDIGDFVGVTGFVFTTRTGETTIHVKSLVLLAKSLKPLPIVKTDAEGNVYDAFTNPELRYRNRYVDLVVNSHVKEIFLARTKIISAMREFFNQHGWLEVETPILQPIHGGASARPFKTHHNSLDIPLYLRIANELYLKRLIVGGFDGVYEFGKMFRNEGMDRTHNPEFTLLEIYIAYKDYIWMMDMVERMVEHTVMAVHGKTKITIGENEVDFKGPYARKTMFDAIEEYAKIDVREMGRGRIGGNLQKVAHRGR